MRMQNLLKSGMVRRWMVSGWWGCVLALLVAAPGWAQQDVFTWSGTLADAQRLEVMDINGDIQVSPSSGNAVSVRAEKVARRGSTSDVEIKVEQEATGIVVCTLYRRADGSFPTGCRERNSRGNKDGWNRSDVRVQYTIQMPALAALEAKTVNGGVTVQGLQGDVQANTVNGDVTLETTGRASAKTVNGKVTAKIGKLDQDSTFSTVNGRIVIAVTDAVNADVALSTVNGRIETDFPITIQGRTSRRNLDGRIGTGGPKLRLSTVNGGIRIEKASL